MNEIRNVAIVAHVDHGKTTLVDHIMRQSKLFRDNQQVRECFLDSNDLERERGITILSKNVSINYKGVKINIIDTPGHCDFGGQVERVLNLADGVLLLVDSAEGPMPQTRFVLDKALKLGLKPLVMINKLDKPDARPKEVLNSVFDLFVELDASEYQLDFPVLYGSGRDGWASLDPNSTERESVAPIMDTIIKYVPGPKRIPGPAQMQVASLDYSEYVGRIGVGRVYRGELDINKPVCLIKRDDRVCAAKLKQIFTFVGLERQEVTTVACGDLCAIVGIEDIDISDTIADIESPEKLPPISVDEPTISMVFRVNDSPFYGQEGKFVTSRHIRARLFKETEKDVALKVEEMLGDAFNVSGRGVLHLAILIENMRREGYELTVSQPRVIFKTENDIKLEPIEELSVETDDSSAGKVIELVGQRRGEMHRMTPRGNRQLIEFEIPTRGIIGLRSKIMTATAGEAIVAHRFLRYAPFKGEVPRRSNGVMISMGSGKVVAYAIDGLQLRGTFFVDVQTDAYEGMIVGEHCKDGDIVVNVQRGKQLTNMRASGTDRALKIFPPQHMSLEEALEYVQDDELVEVTPLNIRLRKRFLTELERKRMRNAKA